MIDYKTLENTPRLLLEVQLSPAQGNRFQPTGFADLGAALYTRPDKDDPEHGVPMLLVESAQSVANRLEKTCLDGDGPDLDTQLKGLPYVATTLRDAEGQIEPIRTSSLIEAHRLASPYFLKTDFGERLGKEMAYSGKGPLNWKRIYTTLFRYDPNSLVHGVFLSLLGDGRVRVPRAVSGFIEAEQVDQVVSGGVKNSPVDPSGEIQVVGPSVERGVYSNVPYARVEFVAKTITAYFNLDLALIRGYGFQESATQLLIALALLKIRRFLTSHLRLRTACDLKLAGAVKTTEPIGFTLPEEATLLGEVQRLVKECAPLFAEPPVTELTTAVKLARTKDASKPADSGVEK
jgi:CRISPR-associated protein Csb1